VIELKEKSKFRKTDRKKIQKEEEADQIEFIRAKYNRSCAVTKKGKVYVWGLGFKLQNLKQP
jgi:alpha-tubulin suppressor-like RCC1 family protein